MASFDDRINDWKPPTADDLEISLPPRREIKKEKPVEEPRDVGQHGGGSDGASTEAHGDAGTGGAEPTPQRDDPDEGEHTDSTQEQVAARAARRVENDAESKDDSQEQPPVDAPAEPAASELELPAPVHREPVDVKKVLAETTGSEPRVFRRTAFSAGDGIDELTLTRFPRVAVDRLRLLLAPTLGGEFSESMSAPALVTAFLVAYAGVELDLDENTTAAADAFRRSDSRVSTIEDKIDLTLDRLLEVAAIAQRSDERSRQTAGVVDALDFGVSFLVTDRVAGLTTADMNETNVDVTSKKVLVARDTIRARTKQQRTIEKQRDGRSIA